MPPPTLYTGAAPIAIVTLEGAEVNSATELGAGTVTDTLTTAPTASRTTMVALPAATPVTVRVEPLTLAVATPVLLLVAE